MTSVLVFLQEPWIIGLLSCEALLLGIVVYFSRSLKLQSSLFVLIGELRVFVHLSIDVW